MEAPQIPVTDLEKLELWAFANYGGQDRLYLVYQDKMHILATDASILNISEAWRDAEFNIFGNGGGGEAIFNAGSSIDVRVAAVYKSLRYDLAPSCVANAGITGETNNLNLETCASWPYPNPANVGTPYIQFTQSN
jgi:hypothetical protein